MFQAFPGVHLPIHDRNITRKGTYTLPRNDAELNKGCSSIASKGIAPICTHSTLWSAGPSATDGLPKDYLRVSSTSSVVEVLGSLGCYLNSDQIQVQSFSERLQAKWAGAPDHSR